MVLGITYNFLPFMILPLYASLERIDPRMLEAGYDLYGRRRDVFLRVTLPLSMPGVVAGTLLMFIPAAGDFINAELLGTPNQYMIGNVIQSRFLELSDYPTAAALSFLLMALMLVIVADLGAHRRNRGAARHRGGGQMRGRRGGRLLDLGLNVYAALGLLYLLVPIAIILVFSFNKPQGRFNFIWQEFSLDAWGDPFGVPGIERRAGQLAADRGDLHAHRHGARHDHRARPRALRVPRPGAGQLLHLHPAGHARGGAGRGAAVALHQLLGGHRASRRS